MGPHPARRRDLGPRLWGHQGPFLESEEVVAGFYILEAPSLDVAVAIAAQNPVVAAGGGVEVRPVHSGGWVQPPQS